MRRSGTILIIIGILSLLLATAGWAQPGMGQGGGPRVHYGTMWDAKTVATVNGEVVSVDKYVPGRGGTTYGLRLTLKTDKETLPLVLGPVWYVEQQHFAFAPKDRLEVRGARLLIQGQPILIAQEVKKGDKVLRMRDSQGVPLWKGPR